MAALSINSQYQRYQKYFLDIQRVYNQKKEVRMFLEVTLTLATIALFTLFALRPTAITISKLLKEIETKQDTLVKMDQKILNLQTAQTTFSRERTRINLLESAIPKNPEPEKYLRQIEGLITKNSLNLLGASAGNIVLAGANPEAEKKSSKGLDQLPNSTKSFILTFTIIGPYQQTNLFLNDIENLRRPLWLDTLIFNTNEQIQGQITTIVTGRIPYNP